MGKPVVHWEFWSEDPEALASFYRSAFDWEVDFSPELDYHMVDTGGEGGINGGFMTPKEGPWPGNMALYLHVEDLAPYRDRIREAGGEIIVAEQEVPGVGELCLFADPDGRVLGLWKPAEDPAAGTEG